MRKSRHFLLFFITLSLFTSVLFWQVFFDNKIPFSANLLASFFNPWAKEKFPGWENGIPNRPTGKDDLWIFYPQRTFTNMILKKGEIPFWNPYSFSGNYHAGLSETAVFYPLNFLFLILSQIDVWVLLIVIEPIIAGTGMFLFLSRIVSSKKSAAFGAFAFAFCGVVIVRSVEGLSVGHSLIWMPYVFWAVESFFQTKKLRYLCLTLLSLSFSLLAGWLQYTVYAFTFSLIYSLFRIYFELKKKSKIYFLVFIPFVLLPFVTLFHTIPAFQTLLDSPRIGLSGSVFSYRHLMPLTHILTLVFPDFWGNPATYNYFGKSDYKESILFIGAAPLIFAIIAAFKRKTKEELFFISAIVISLGLAIDSAFSRFIITSPVMIFNSFLPNRVFLITTFSFCVLAACGFDYLAKKKKIVLIKKIKNNPIFILLIFLIIGSFLIYIVKQDTAVLYKDSGAIIKTGPGVIQLRNSALPLVFLFITIIIFVIFRNNYSRNIFFLTIIVVLFLQSFLFGQKYIPFSYRQFLYPDHPVISYLQKQQRLDRFMSIGHGHIVPSIPLQFNLYSPEGIGSMYIRRYGELVSYMKLGEHGIPDKIAFDHEIYPQDVFNPKNESLHRFYELTSVKYIVSDKKSMTESGVVPDMNVFPLIWKSDKWLIYQYKKSMPRFFVTSNFSIVKNQKEILNSLFGKDFNATKIILEENPGFNPKESSGSATITDYSPNRISAEVNAKNNSLFYLSDNYSKMFKVFIDGKEGKILRANYTFRAVPIPKGEHTIEMKYDDRLFVLSLEIAVFTFSILGILTYISRKYF